MIVEKEKQILKLIKYAPPIFIISMSLVILSFLYMENIRTFQKEKEKIQVDYLKKNKEMIKKQVHDVYDFIKREQKSTVNDLKISLKEALQNSYSIADALYKNNQDKPLYEIKKLITDALRNIRFNEGRGYFFIYEKNGKNVMDPSLPELEGKNLWNYQDARGSYTIRESVKLLKNKNESYQEWYWYKSNDSRKERKKIGLVRNFEPFNWFIGTGEYVIDFEKQLQEKLLRHIREIRYGKNGYIFIIDYETRYLSHIRKNYIGKKALINNDTQSNHKTLSEAIEIAKKGEGYYSYIQVKKPDTNLATKKISFVKGLNSWSWMIGTGFYEDDKNAAIQNKKDVLDKKLNKYIQNIVTVSILLTIVLLLISMYISKLLKEKLQEYKREINKHLANDVKQQNILAQQSKMAAMGEMIGNIAHQWRQPLSTITVLSTGMKLKKQMNLLDDENLVKGLESINNSAQHLSKTIDDFRNFFSLSKKSKLFNMNDAIDKSLSLYVLLNSRVKILSLLKISKMWKLII